MYGILIYLEFSYGLELEIQSLDSVVRQWIMKSLVVTFLSFNFLGCPLVGYNDCCISSMG